MSARTSIDAFSLFHDDGSVHYERDHDLFIHTKSALRGGDRAALLLVELGIDGYQTHQVRLDFLPVDNDDDPDAFQYDRRTEEVRALSDAIETLTALRDRLALMA